jgi:hypothetical protein
MYNQDIVRVMHPTEGLSARFSCGIGVKQGYPLSPLLFGLYLDGLEKHLDALDGDNPPQLANIVVKLLMYADDVITLALGSRPRQRGLQGYGPKGRKPRSQGKGIARVWAKRKPGSHITYS